MKTKVAIIGLSGQSIFMNVNEFHKLGETKQVKELYIEPGGKGYNQAIACNRFDMDVYYLTSVGNDEYGKHCEKVMKECGINTTFIYKELPTALATIITDDKGENQVSVYSGANDLLNLNDLESFKLNIKNSDILLVNNEIPYPVLKEAITYAKKNNVYVILNPAPNVYDIQELLSNIDLLIPNEVEAQYIYKKAIDDIVVDNEVIITLGKNGCKYLNKEISKSYEAIKVKAIDSTGAGDVFCSAIASKIKDKDINKAIEFALKASSIHVTKKHVINAIPYLKDIK